MQITEFDHVVDVRDPRTGAIIQRNDYILHVGANGKEYERPPHSGMFYDPTGKLIRDAYKEKREQELVLAKTKAEDEKKAQMAKIEIEKKELLAEAQAEANAIREQAMKDAEDIKAKAGEQHQKKGH